VQESKERSDPRFESVIEWRGFLVSLADAHFDYIISAATMEDIVQARTGIIIFKITKVLVFYCMPF